MLTLLINEVPTIIYYHSKALVALILDRPLLDTLLLAIDHFRRPILASQVLLPDLCVLLVLTFFNSRLLDQCCSSNSLLDHHHNSWVLDHHHNSWVLDHHRNSWRLDQYYNSQQLDNYNSSLSLLVQICLLLDLVFDLLL